jgi:aminoglycoside phosphotransferase (APT) family kinase protein
VSGTRPSTEDVLGAFDEALAALGISHGRLGLTRPPHFHARSTIFFVADGPTPRGGCRWVIKCPDETARQDDLPTPLTAEGQYRALQVLTAHFASVAPRLTVSRPVAYLPAVGGLATEYVRGTSVDELVRPGNILRLQALLDSVASSGRFLRHLHSLEAPRGTILNTRALADEVLELADARLAPAGLVLPAPALDALRDVPDVDASVGAVVLHGDFAPVNMLVDGAGSVTGLDVSMTEIGPAEDDLARFLMMLVTHRLFLASAGWTRLRALRTSVQGTLLEAYAGDAGTSVFLELRFIQQLCLRWLQRHNARVARDPYVSGFRARVVDRLFSLLLAERAEMLATAPRTCVSPCFRAAAKTLQRLH